MPHGARRDTFASLAVPGGRLQGMMHWSSLNMACPPTTSYRLPLYPADTPWMRPGRRRGHYRRLHPWTQPPVPWTMPPVSPWHNTGWQHIGWRNQGPLSGLANALRGVANFLGGFGRPSWHQYTWNHQRAGWW